MYIVLEMQATGNEVGIITTSYENYNQASSKFHQIMAAAALSKVPTHSAVIIDEHCEIHESGMYEHKEG